MEHFKKYWTTRELSSNHRLRDDRRYTLEMFPMGHCLP